MIQAFVLINNEVIISQSLPETDEDTGEAYFNLMYPYLLKFNSENTMGFELTPWLSDITDDTENFILYPDKIITVKEPKENILNFYKKLVLFDQDKVLKDDGVKQIKQSVNKRNEIRVEPEMQTIVSSGPIDKNDFDEIFNEEEQED